MDKCIPEPNSGCWLWIGGTSTNRYGIFRAISLGRKTALAHRFAYEAFNGPIPEGKEIDHKCNNRTCVNPDHLTAVVHLENCQRYNSSIKHCPRGHEYTSENTRIQTSREGYQLRHCRTCDNARQRKRWPQ